MDVTFHTLALVLAKHHTSPTHTFSGITLKCLLKSAQPLTDDTQPILPNDLITCSARGDVGAFIENALRIGDTVKLSLMPPSQQGASWRVVQAHLDSAYTRD